MCMIILESQGGAGVQAVQRLQAWETCPGRGEDTFMSNQVILRKRG